MKKTIEFTINLPDWAEWLAVDWDGTITVFQCEPYSQKPAWHVDFGLSKIIGHLPLYVDTDWDWKETKLKLRDYR